MTMDAKDREILDQINRKVQNSPVLNGGFDKLILTVEYIKEIQDKTANKVENISDALYEPMTGLFSRVQATEAKTGSLEYQMETAAEACTDSVAKIDSVVKGLTAKDDSAQKLQDASDLNRLRRIAGEDLQNLESAIKLQKSFQKLYWAAGLAVLTPLAKFVWDLIMPHIGH